MTKSDATALGIFGFGAAALTLMNSADKNTKIAALDRQVSGLGQELRVRTARVESLESEQGELLRAREAAQAHLEHANQRIAALGIEANGLRNQLTAKDAELAQLREELAAAKGAKKP